MYRGEQIYFRTLTSDDVDIMMVWENNPENWKISSTTHSYTRDQIQEFVDLNQDIYVHEQLRLLICLNDTNEVIGNIDLFDFEPVHKRVGVGILIDKKYRKQGYASKSIVLIEEYCKLILDVKNLFCNILVDNEASINLFEKNGFNRLTLKPKWHFYNGDWFDEYFYFKKID